MFNTPYGGVGGLRGGFGRGVGGGVRAAMRGVGASAGVVFRLLLGAKRSAYLVFDCWFYLPGRVAELGYSLGGGLGGGPFHNPHTVIVWGFPFPSFIYLMGGV